MARRVQNLRRQPRNASPIQCENRVHRITPVSETIFIERAELVYAIVPRRESIRAMALRTRTELKVERAQAAWKKKLDTAGISRGIDAIRFAARLELKKYGIVWGPRARRGRPPRGWDKPLWLPLIEETRKDLASGLYRVEDLQAR
jgi:hypothetical protein